MSITWGDCVSLHLNDREKGMIITPWIEEFVFLFGGHSQPWKDAEQRGREVKLTISPFP